MPLIKLTSSDVPYSVSLNLFCVLCLNAITKKGFSRKPVSGSTSVLNRFCCLMCNQDLTPQQCWTPVCHQTEAQFIPQKKRRIKLALIFEHGPMSPYRPSHTQAGSADNCNVSNNVSNISHSHNFISDGWFLRSMRGPHEVYVKSTWGPHDYEVYVRSTWGPHEVYVRSTWGLCEVHVFLKLVAMYLQHQTVCYSLKQCHRLSRVDCLTCMF